MQDHYHESVVVIQARTNSVRLPGKVLLPIGGLPIAGLAAKRAGNTGRKIILATSHEPTDDALTRVILDLGIPVYRGSLDNVLKRYVEALKQYGDETIVFRLTADNIFPDGRLLDEIENEFLESNISYMKCIGVESGLPYGMSAEVTRLRYLREALANTADPYDLEHVTPYISRTYGSHYFKRYFSKSMAHYRCTIDCFDDYITIHNIFSTCSDPINTHSMILVEKLQNETNQSAQKGPVDRLVLGAAQLGLDYGITNINGKPSEEDSTKLIKMAILNGVEYIDTARAYGNSEEVIGNSLKSGWQGRVKVITKLSPLVNCPENANIDTVNAFVDASIYESCAQLMTKSIEVLLLHRTSHLQKWDGSVWNRLRDLQEQGIIKDLGVSVQDPNELEIALNNKDVSYIQMPYNILDWRWDKSISQIKLARSSRKLTIHIRSAFLQGLLISQEPRIWKQARIDNPMELIEWLEDRVTSFKRKSVKDLCLSFVNSMNWIDGICIGMTCLDQLLENIRLFQQPKLSDSDIETLISERPVISEAALNPASWGAH
ncbi:MAG: aldo/keto reductase [Oligoflexus sp.]